MPAVAAAAVALFFFFPLSHSGGWDARPRLPDLAAAVPGVGRIPELDGRRLDVFYARFWEQRPVILRRATLGHNQRFRQLAHRSEMLRRWGHVELTLSSANTNSYARKKERLETYVETRLGPQNISQSGADTWYQFGDNVLEMERELLVHYERPAAFMRHVNHSALSFGLAGTGSGVPMHTHAAVFAEVIFGGAKRWFLTPPDVKPEYNGSESMLHWFRHRLPRMENRSFILDGICNVGDLIYLPSFWYHSTLNIGQIVFVSTFI